MVLQLWCLIQLFLTLQTEGHTCVSGHIAIDGRSVSLAVEAFLGFLPRFLYMCYRFLGFFLTAVRQRDRGRHHDTLIDVQLACRRVRPIYGLNTRFLPVLTFSLLSPHEVRSGERKRPLSVFIKLVHITRKQYSKPIPCYLHLALVKTFVGSSKH